MIKNIMIKIKFLDVCMLKPGGTHDATYLRKYIFLQKKLWRMLYYKNLECGMKKKLKTMYCWRLHVHSTAITSKTYNAWRSNSTNKYEFDKYL